MLENGLETESEEKVCEKEISKEDDLSDPENIISKDGDHLKNGELISHYKETLPRACF